MIKEVKIQNYKSVQDLTLELGRVNVLIGANGCGKSNILEAIAMGSAAAEDKLSNEFLSSRGIRVTEPKAMRSGFEIDNKKKIDIRFKSDHEDYSAFVALLQHLNSPFSTWENTFNLFDIANKRALSKFLKSFVKQMDEENEWSNVEELNKLSKKEQQKLISNLITNEVKETVEVTNQYFANFLVYTPENTFLRKFEDESQIEPLGIKGEGLFKLLSVMSSETPEEFQELIENLELIDWFEGFEIPKDLVFTERRIRIKDRFLDEGLKYFDQRSSNEGFLYLMFYFALFISKYTPKFFAIDNIDASLNPKLCSELIKILTKLAKKHDKQVIFTTHNPAILDGLNLNDDEQRLMVVYRNVHGHTKTKRITKKETPEGSEPVRLSEQFLRGYLGGLPKNF